MNGLSLIIHNLLSFKNWNATTLLITLEDIFMFFNICNISKLLDVWSFQTSRVLSVKTFIRWPRMSLVKKVSCSEGATCS